ncbi:MAG: threonylcarbamoyl-AMP synthase [Flavobacteriales bacterium]|nr:threonylcarbamoyl-AMP synthase [Flavobacteriales bacterium]MCC6936977.1 threonylcarbamoyl-AMP synthase [Flavobacteriales bacterium]
MLITLHPTHPETRKIRTAVEALRSGAVIICPTDTVYAYVCSSESARAIEEVARLKGVKPHKAELSLICADLSQLSAYARSVDTATFRLMKRALPGPYTFILQASAAIPKLFKNNRRTVGIRVPDHPVPMALVNELGHALVAASVHDPDQLLDYTADPERIDEHIGHQVEFVLDAGVCGLEGSTIIDVSDGAPVILREGKGPVDDLF